MQHNFVHLRVHSAYSLLEGAIRLKDLVTLAKNNKMPAVGAADTNNLFGALEFALAAKENGVQPIIACQLHVTDPFETTAWKAKEPTPLVLIVKNETGYVNLSHMMSVAYLEKSIDGDPFLDIDDLEGYTEGLICLTGGPNSILNSKVLKGNLSDAESWLLRLNKLFPDNLYVELQRHHMPGEAEVEEDLLDLAYKHNLPIVATNEVFFAKKEQYEAHDALICISEGRYIVEPDRRRLTEEHYFKSSEEMCKIFEDLPEAIENTLNIAKRCSFMPTARDPILPLCPQAQGKSEAEVLKEIAFSGLEKRLEEAVYPELQSEKDFAAKKEEIGKPYFERLEYELGVIDQMGFQGYFLIVADFIQWAKEKNIPVGPGRGSGAGSVVAWALFITDLNPLQWGLLFERFLNPERVSMPDFDIDFCQDRRDEVIEYVQKRYGVNNVAQIITFGSLQARAVLRDVGRVLQLPYSQVDRICKLVPNNPANPVTLKEALDLEPLFAEMQRTDPKVKSLIDMSLELEGLYRHASTHAAGVVIADRPLEQLIPLYRDPRSDMPVTQFNMKMAEKAGLVKFDFLGLKTLTVIANTVKLLAEQGIEVDINNLPLDHKETYEMIARGETVGVFQLESSGMKDVLRKLRPDRFEDLIAVVALYRPGPMDNIPKYISVKHGQEKADYLYPSLEPILKETYGIMIYQEQVMEIAQVLSGYSLGSADLLRRAMGKKIKEEMEAQRKIFVEGAVKNDVPESKAAQIFDQVNKFAGYGFNKSHAAAYALIAYQTAYLKANYPTAFFVASMQLDLQNTDKLHIFAEELKRLEIDVLPPDIQLSAPHFKQENQGEQEAIRYALAAVKGAGEQAMQHIYELRETMGGKFKSLGEFLSNMDPRMVNKRQFEALISSGALDSLHPSRRQLFDSVENLLSHAQNTSRAKASNQMGLFDHAAPESINEIDHLFLQVPDWSNIDRLQKEYQVIGFYLKDHPLDSYQDAMKELHVFNDPSLDALRGKDFVKLAGVPIEMKEKKSSKGSKFAFVRFSTAHHTFDVTVFSEVLGGSRELLQDTYPLVMTVEVQAGENDYRFVAQSVQLLEDALGKVDREKRIEISDPETLAMFKVEYEQMKKGNTKIILETEIDIGPEIVKVEVELPERKYVQ